jgi:hypothetical protein
MILLYKKNDKFIYYFKQLFLIKKYYEFFVIHPNFISSNAQNYKILTSMSKFE